MLYDFLSNSFSRPLLNTFLESKSVSNVACTSYSTLFAHTEYRVLCDI